MTRPSVQPKDPVIQPEDADSAFGRAEHLQFLSSVAESLCFCWRIRNRLRTLEQLVGLERDKEAVILMPGVRRTIRLAFTAGVVCLQLFLLPASQLLHVTCDHSQSHEATHQESAHRHCSHHHHNHSSSDHQIPDSDPGTQIPHDSGDCAICQVILAARVDELHEVQVPASDLIVDAVGAYLIEVPPTSVPALLSRGPPA